ncbi:MAG: thermonuclease family protein [Proteobacteria bacterium]|nr:thermonuclease family protein [Pseudomonadota bacterium]
MKIPISSNSPSSNTFRLFSFYLAIILSFIITSSPSPAYSSSTTTDTFTGQCVDVADGDTITVQSQTNEKIKIRLAGIDSPEGVQAHGEKSKQYLSSLVYGKRVRIEPETIDKYGRTVGMVLVNGSNINEQIVVNGHAWVFRKYCVADYCKDWLKLEEKARKARIGLWVENNPQPPWDWRAEKKNGSSGGNVVPAVIPAGSVGSSSTTSATAVYHGNTRSHVFHGPSCKDYNCKNCTVILGSVNEAVGAGYRKHSRCVD